MPPRLQPLKMFGEEDGLLKPGADPAEETLAAAKKFMNERKKAKSKKEQFPEDTWEDEGGSIIEEDEVYVNEEEVKEILSSGEELDIEEPDDAFNPKNIHPLYHKYNALVRELQRLRDKKGKDYGTKKDPFANVRGAEEFGVKPWIGAANSANDCLTRIKNYAKNGRLENESVRDSMLDLANYALIALVLWEEENEKES